MALTIDYGQNVEGKLPDMIVVMGITGSGKSYLVNKLANADVAQTSARLNSCKLSFARKKGSRLEH